ncbi:hypothetical protein MSG28_010249 [Choristoneura fumiferana]|uniref:Uncharacterized protein n=1 Tax=Choristoneura fumiferana TaxID=7141 RepID=A0ACC0KJW4_CHOFU|nr:hypothetical protein MSG28_010249 [Choristoneura fumiferana]
MSVSSLHSRGKFGGLRAPEKQETAKSTATERPSNRKSKKLASWSNKAEFSHPWLLKNLKGHPGTVLHMDFSANGKFMAATCDGYYMGFLSRVIPSAFVGISIDRQICKQSFEELQINLNIES